MRAVSSYPRPPGGGFVGTNVPYSILQNGIAFIWVSSGTMGNNGALSAITALPLTYSEGCYMLFPAGAIAAGVPAAATWYWVTMSSTTAGTVFNSTYTSGIPAPGTATAFATTGPGAYTGVIAETTAIQVTLNANSMGIRGKLRMMEDYQATNNANAKTINRKFGGVAIQSPPVIASQAATTTLSVTSNRGVTNVQYTFNSGLSGNGLGNTGGTRTTIDTTASVVVSITSSRVTATDNIILDTALWEVFA